MARSKLKFTEKPPVIQAMLLPSGNLYVYYPDGTEEVITKEEFEKGNYDPKTSY
jgi:hypothetical protein